MVGETTMRMFKLLLAGAAFGLAALLFPTQSIAKSSKQESFWSDRCARVVNDDTVRSFKPSLKFGFLKAYKLLFPDDPNEPDSGQLKLASFRCMDGHLLACFVGVNLPCGKLDVSRKNRGAAAFCRQHPDENTVPMAATGHDTIYFFKCSKQSAEVKEQNWTVDYRGFGVELWKPMN